jgi:peptidoglycan hydrolase CwlO-like protein
MRKYLILLPAIAMVVLLYSCSSSSSFENDVRKMANYRCKTQQLTAKAATDENAQKELEKLEKEIEEYNIKMKEKYKDQKDEKKEEQADNIFKDVMDKCK